VPQRRKKPSESVAQIKIRLRRGSKHLDEDMEMLHKATGRYKPLEEWDLEELARGMPRNKNGGFSGAAPTWITPAVAKEAKRRLTGHAFGKLAKNLDWAVAVLENLLTSEDVDDNGRPLVDAKTKLAAATFIIEHIIGKSPAHLSVGVDDQVSRGPLVSTFVLPNGSPKHEVLEGTYVVDDDDEEDDEEEEYDDDDED
jgi:hypothetical protein